MQYGKPIQKFSQIFPGHEPDRFIGKLIQFFSNFNFEIVSQIVLLENLSIEKSWVPIQSFQKSSREPDRITGKLIHSKNGPNEEI